MNYQRIFNICSIKKTKKKTKFVIKYKVRITLKVKYYCTRTWGKCYN